MIHGSVRAARGGGYKHPQPTVGTDIDMYSKPSDQETRIRMALGLAQGPLPEVGIEWLHRYYEYLVARLSLPFDAEYAEDVPGHRLAISPVTVTALIPPDQCATSEEVGLLCRARREGLELEFPLVDAETKEDAPNHRLLEDYWYWFWNWRFDPQI